MSRKSDPEGKYTRKTIFMQARKNEEKALPAALRTLCEKTKFLTVFYALYKKLSAEEDDSQGVYANTLNSNL
jgi:hypothetical protein